MMATRKSAKIPAQYSKLSEELKGDKSFCAVVAIAAITKVPAKQVQELLAQCGRKLGCGTEDHQMSKALGLLGYKVTRDVQIDKIVGSYPGRHWQLKNATTHHPRRFKAAWANQPDMMIFTAEHVCAFVDGQLVDWTVKKSKRILYIWTLEKVV